MKKKLYIFLAVGLLAVFQIGCLNNNSNSNKFQFVDAIDKFGEVSKEEKAIVGIFDGLAKEAISTNREIKVKVQVSRDKNSHITFLESDNSVINLPESTPINIEVKKEDGSTESIKQFILKNTMSDIQGTLIEKVLSQNSPLIIRVDLGAIDTNEDRVFTFKIDPNGLNDLLSK